MKAQSLGASTSTNITLTIMPKQNTNYINGWGSIFTRKHPSLNYGQTGRFSTDASCRKGHAWFWPSSDSEGDETATQVRLRHIFTKDSSYANGTEA